MNKHKINRKYLTHTQPRSWQDILNCCDFNGSRLVEHDLRIMVEELALKISHMNRGEPRGTRALIIVFINA